MQSTYFICGIVIASLVLWPEETTVVLVAASLKIQIFYINYRMKFMAWRMHRQLVKLSKEAGWPEPPPFTFVNLWDRKAP